MIGRDDAHLRATLTAVAEEGACILKAVAGDLLGDDAPAGHGITVDGFDKADLPGWNLQKLAEGYSVLPRPQTPMQSRRQRIRLVAGFTLNGDDAARGERFILTEQDKFLGDETDTIVWDDDDAEQPQYHAITQADHDQHSGDYQPFLVFHQPVSYFHMHNSCVRGWVCFYFFEFVIC